MQRHTRQTAFTLVEVLVVIAVLAILLLLILPAVQGARHAVLRTQCQGNLHQIGVACHNYYQQNKKFPAGLDSQSRDQWYLSWMARLLPFVDQNPLSLNVPAEYQRIRTPWGFASEGPGRPHEGLGTHMPLYMCAAETRELIANPVDLGSHTGAVAFTTYLGSSGSRCGADDGIFYNGSAVKLDMITDGQSNTLLVGERPPSADLIFGWWYAGAGYGDPQFGQVGTGDVILGTREANYAAAQGYIGTTCDPSKVNFQPGKVDDPCDQVHYWSFHPGGANFLFADGSARFLSYDVDPLLPALSTRAGKEEIPRGFFQD